MTPPLDSDTDLDELQAELDLTEKQISGLRTKIESADDEQKSALQADLDKMTNARDELHKKIETQRQQQKAANQHIDPDAPTKPGTSETASPAGKTPPKAQADNGKNGSGDEAKRKANDRDEGSPNDNDNRESRERFLFIRGEPRRVDDLTIVGLVFLAGVLGGLCANVIGIKVPYHTTPEGKAIDYLNWAQMAFAGMVAAGLTVFYVARTDTRNVLRTFFFAIICGLSGPTLIRSAASQAGALSLTSMASENQQKVDALKKDDSTASDAEITDHSEALLSVAASSVSTVKKAQSTGDVDAESKADLTGKQAADALGSFAQKVASVKPEAIDAPVTALASIIEKAEAAGNKAIAAAASNALGKLPPRIYLEVAETLSPPDLARLRQRARAFKAIIPAQDLSAVDDKAAELLYYRAEDAGIANGIVANLNELLSAENQVKATLQAAGAPGGYRPGHYDLRLGKGTLANLKAKLSATTP